MLSLRHVAAARPGLATLLCLIVLLSQCAPAPKGSQSGAAAVRPSGSGGFQHIINVSSYDPKTRSRSGRSYSEHDLSAFRANGASGLIARAGKGGNLDTKCATFLSSADRVNLLPGVYYRVQRHVSATRQADQFVSRAKSLARSRNWNASSLLLCGDYDADLPLSSILAFMDRVESLTGVVPVAYLENSTELKQRTRAADRATRARLLRAPYWLALYSHESGAGPVFPAPGSPGGLVKQYNLWPDWTMWQYGGVGWERGAAHAKVYSHGRYRFPRYFGDLDRPIERNVFRGSRGDLNAFWKRHGLRFGSVVPCSGHPELACHAVHPVAGESGIVSLAGSDCGIRHARSFIFLKTRIQLGEHWCKLRR